MAKRSLQASSAGIQQAKRAFALKGWTQENLAGEISLKTRQPIWRFFSGQPVDRQAFLGICTVLDLDWREVAIDPPEVFLQVKPVALSPVGLDRLVGQVRLQQREKVQNQCGILQLLDINHPVSLDDIYIDVNILEAIASQQRLEVANLQNIEPEAFARVGLGDIEQRQISGMRAVETYPKLRVLGKPGVGKTTFLQHLAVQCSRGEFEASRVPMFITLRHFVEESSASGELSLLNYLRQEFLTSGISDPAVIETLLQAGRLLLLLDGIDEVLHPQSMLVLREIRRFSDKYHKNQYVVTCRTAAQKLSLRGFTDVELAPFTQAQITAFAQKWFVSFTLTTAQSGQAQSDLFMQKLGEPENWQFRQMVVTPLFLHMACWVFQGEGRFPVKRTEFYKEGLDLLLVKWDESRGVERDEIYRGFRLPQKLKLLSQIAAVTFEQGQYFFAQRTIEQYIEDYIRHLPNASTDAEELQLDSKALLKAIESQHGLLIERGRGVFSFSYLAFQEYFTARSIVASHNLQALEQALGGLVSHLTDPHWHEIFLLTAAMLRSADSLVQLMKQQIDALVAEDPYLQEFLQWASQKSRVAPAPIQDAAARAFYLGLSRMPHMAADFALACTLDQGMFLDAALDDLLQSCAIDQSPDFAHAHLCGEALSQILVMVLDAGFYKSLQQLQMEFSPPGQTEERFQLWWQAHHGAWATKLKSEINSYRQIHHHWQFSLEQQQMLQRYYDANQLLLDCLNSSCEITATIRQEIEATLLLPQRELEDREWQDN
ncbi:MAG: NACHT domain-containing NTPase [Pegethrix bostrychoides GSE-TBD4-15B]|jgi:predicted NACHT family NTPase|uniref:NACHT domain-containing NTPase n=1 Tax=Pegethrix bostrychoides GSE-TBD4-15B TaxID=2839662 RepID=A0A951U4A6_9CYAN|nr:NACHT domain-containing NTPase [Pegethrix bostrychoides GSE-TBD4-15B]